MCFCSNVVIRVAVMLGEVRTFNDTIVRPVPEPLDIGVETTGADELSVTPYEEAIAS
ncbi:hypothetical protein GCM10020331_021430 [Ectobacillus funiculus]